MIVVISPAKTLDFDSPSPCESSTCPNFLQQSQILINQLKKLQPDEVSSLMGISEKLGLLNWERFQTWQLPFPQDRAKQAVYAFKGDVYTGLKAEKLDEDAVSFMQNHLRILSGLYGLLKPLDLILPYRLEMGTRLKNTKGQNLYQFWGNQLTEKLNEDFISPHPVLINLASKEYFNAVLPGKLKAKIITPVFKDLKNGKYKIISFYAKKARGLMTSYICQNRISNPELLKLFSCEGYGYAPEQSSEDTWIFLRDGTPNSN